LRSGKDYGGAPCISEPLGVRMQRSMVRFVQDFRTQHLVSQLGRGDVVAYIIQMLGQGHDCEITKSTNEISNILLLDDHAHYGIMQAIRAKVLI
jgi:hypothetical protein